MSPVSNPEITNPQTVNNIPPPSDPEIKPEWANADQDLINQPINQPVPPVMQDIPKKKANKFVLIIILAMVLMALGALGVLAYQKYFSKPIIQPINNSTNQPVSTPDPTADWKTYTNKTNKFSFKYPDSYFKYISDTQYSIYLAPTEGSGAEADTPMALSQSDVWLNIYYKSADSEQKDQPKTLIVSKGPQPTTTFQAKLINQNVVYTIELVGFNEETLNKYEPMFDQILSTLKFNDQSQIQSEQQEVINFANQFAQAYIYSDWIKLKSMLTQGATQEMTNNQINLGASGTKMYSKYNIVSVTKNATGDYQVEIQFYSLDGSLHTNPTGNPKILVVKENGSWKSMTWYLFQ